MSDHHKVQRPADLDDRSTMLVILPLASIESQSVSQESDGLGQKGGSESGFDDIDPDVDLPANFFRSLSRRAIPDHAGHIELDRPSGSTTAGAGNERISIGIAHVSVVGVDSDVVGAEFLVVRALPPSLDPGDWFDSAKVLSSVEASRALCSPDILGGPPRSPRSDDTRPTVLLAAYHTGTADDRETYAAHLATRAPLSQELWRRPELTGVRSLSDHHCRFITPRIIGFVVDAAGGAGHFERKFLEELDAQYLLGVVLTLWQRVWMEQMLGEIQDTWMQTETGAGWKRGRAISRRLSQLRSLRHRHAVLIASGTFGPAFDSGSQAQFWDEIQERFAIRARRQQLDSALDALAGTAEIQASTNLERILGFFTLVVGVPSLVFAVLGVNIDQVTSNSEGVSVVLALGIFVACLSLGAGAFLLMSGYFSAGRRSTTDDLVGRSE